MPVADGYETLNVEAQKAAEKSNLKVYQSLTALRQDKVFRYGRYDSLALNESVFAFRRYSVTFLYYLLNIFKHLSTLKWLITNTVFNSISDGTKKKPIW